MFENPRRGRQARNFTTNVPKILDLKSSSEQIFFRKLSLGAPEHLSLTSTTSSAVAWSNDMFLHDANDSKVHAEYIDVRICELKGGHNY